MSQATCGRCCKRFDPADSVGFLFVILPARPSLGEDANKVLSLCPDCEVTVMDCLVGHATRSLVRRRPGTQRDLRGIKQ
jgi:hypothetical protein